MTGFWMSVCPLIIILIIGFADVEATIGTKDVEGTNVDIEEYPWQAAIYIKDKFTCAATIISEKHVLTSNVFLHDYVNAKNLDDITVVVGTARLNSDTGEKHSVEALKIYPEYVEENLVAYDLAILKLKTEILFDKKKKSIPLPDADVPVGAKVTTTEWDQPAWNALTVDLKKHDLEIMDKAECSTNKMKSDGSIPDPELLDSQICTLPGADRWNCEVIMGGALVHKGVLVGINSWVHSCLVRFPIINDYPPRIYTRIYNYVGWIRDTMKNL